MKKVVGKIWRAMPNRARRAITRLTQTNFTISVSAVIFDSAERILLLNHVLRPTSGWDIVGGYVNANEDPAEALRRESFEEADITIKNLELILFYTKGHHFEITYQAEIDTGQAKAKSREIIETHWFKPDELPPELDETPQMLINLARENRRKKT